MHRLQNVERTNIVRKQITLKNQWTSSRLDGSHWSLSISNKRVAEFESVMTF